jgi:hypothetical protein
MAKIGFPPPGPSAPFNPPSDQVRVATERSCNGGDRPGASRPRLIGSSSSMNRSTLLTNRWEIRPVRGDSPLRCGTSPECGRHAAIPALHDLRAARQEFIGLDAEKLLQAPALDPLYCFDLAGTVKRGFQFRRCQNVFVRSVSRRRGFDARLVANLVSGSVSCLHRELYAYNGA